MLQRSIEDELQFRSSLRNFGVNQWDKITATEQRSESKKRRRTSALAAGNNDDTDTECDECRVSLFFSRVECKLPGDSTVVWCLQHALEKIKDFPGTDGVFTFSATDHNGLGIDAFEMMTVKDGKFVPYKK